MCSPRAALSSFRTDSTSDGGAEAAFAHNSWMRSVNRRDGTRSRLLEERAECNTVIWVVHLAGCSPEGLRASFSRSSFCSSTSFNSVMMAANFSGFCSVAACSQSSLHRSLVSSCTGSFQSMGVSVSIVSCLVSASH